MDLRFDDLMYWLEPFIRALGDVLWGDLLATPRGFAYLALAIGLTYFVAVVRARRMYERALSAANIEAYNLRSGNTNRQAEVQLRGILDDKLRLDVAAKFRTVLLWVVMLFTMLAVQAYALQTQEWMRLTNYLLRGDAQSSITVLDASPLPYYRQLVYVFGGVAVTVLITWVWSFWANHGYGPPAKNRTLCWVVDLVLPIRPNTPLNRVQRIVMRWHSTS